ncbi:MAG: hypothetical protein DRJ65_04785 [Acidobacteria bacterium]|nr:MAG: hypothetical protein DRJ65_04785 [Acidobacteriota bacterium]
MAGHQPDRYTQVVEFRTKLLSTLKAIQSVLDVPGVMVIGSEVPNLLQPEAASTLVVSQDVDIGVPVKRIEEVKTALQEVVGLEPSEEEPSVWLPSLPDIIEVNFVGMDPDVDDPTGAFVIEDARLPLLVFGALSLLREGPAVAIEGLEIPLPRPAGLLLEKLLTERVAEKGVRDLLVVVGLLVVMVEADHEELVEDYLGLPAELRYAVRSNLTILSLMQQGMDGMPDPRPHRGRIAELLIRFEALGAEAE